ncbi:hypothetical protein BLA29_004040, partial [Euroglyphus maynei]
MLIHSFDINFVKLIHLFCGSVVRTWICRKRFNEMRNAAVIVQTFVRRFIAQKRLKRLKMIAQYENWAANAIQKHWRAYQTRKWFTNLRKSIVKFQACCRGHLFRKTNHMNEVIEECARAREKEQKQTEQESSIINNNNKMSNVSVLIRTTPPNSSSASSSATIKEGDGNLTSSTFTNVHHQNEIVIHNISSNMDANQDANLIIPVNVINRSTVTAKIGDGGDEEFSSSLIDVDDDLVDLDDDFENGDNQRVRLNRKRNIPIRKTSFKRKANNKSLSDEKLLMTTSTSPATTTTASSSSTSTLESSTTATNSNANITIANDHNFNQQQQHRQLTKLSSDSKVLGHAGSNSSFVSSGYLTNSDSASSIQKLRIG